MIPSRDSGSEIAVIFDMDGVLIDSEPAWQAAEQEVLGALGVPLTPSMMAETTGLRVDAVVQYWRTRYGFPGATADIGSAITQAVAHWVQRSGEALPGVLSCLKAIRGEKLLLGLATSSGPLLIDAVIERLGLADVFDARVAGTEVERGKPDPAIYQLCAQRLAMPVTRCVAIEDSVAGVTSARRAGMPCVGVGGPGIDRSALLQAGASLWVENLAQLDVGELRQLCPSGPTERSDSMR